MPNFKSQQGIIPLFILIAIGVAVLAGGTYIVRSEFVKTGKSGKSALDQQKVAQQIKNPKALPSISPQPTAVAQRGPFTYKPSATTNTQTATGSADSTKEPGFTIMGPSGWNRIDLGQPNFKVTFEHPEEDKENGEDDLVLKVKARLSVVIMKFSGDLEAGIKNAKSASSQNYEQLNIFSESKTSLVGQEAYRLEAQYIVKGIKIHTLDYYLVKNGYAIHLAGNALDSAWSKRAGEIQSSINSFKFTD